MENKTFTIIGTGFIFERHVNAIRAIGGEIVDVVNNFGGKNRNFIKALLETQAKYIVILTPNDCHFDMALIARRMGKIVLSEKPLAICSNQVQMLSELGQIYTVLQLRHHPLVTKIKKRIAVSEEKPTVVGIDIAVHRDKEYFDSWKGLKGRSGGLLFNLGIHYFDLLLHLFGPYKKATMQYCDEMMATGKISGNGYKCNWKLSVAENKKNQRRIFEVDGKEYNFSSKDNLSFENLHIKVYEDLIQGKGVTPNEVMEATKLIEELYAKK